MRIKYSTNTTTAVANNYQEYYSPFYSKCSPIILKIRFSFCRLAPFQPYEAPDILVFWETRKPTRRPILPQIHS